MEKQRASQLLEEAREIYQKSCMRGFESWVDEYSGNNGDKDYLLEVREYIRKRNSCANSRVFGIDSVLIEDILREVPFTNQ